MGLWRGHVCGLLLLLFLCSKAAPDDVPARRLVPGSGRLLPRAWHERVCTWRTWCMHGQTRLKLRGSAEPE
jgi:hypothetical protein